LRERPSSCSPIWRRPADIAAASEGIEARHLGRGHAADARLCGDTRGRDGGVRKELGGDRLVTD